MKFTKTGLSSNLELLLLTVFKWIVIAAMIILALSVAGFLVTGFFQFVKIAAKPEPIGPTAKPTFSISDFLLTVKPLPPEKPPQSPALVAPLALAVDVDEEVFRAQGERLWEHVNKYQLDCIIAAPLSKKDFLESLKQTPLKSVLSARTADFALSQDAFVKATLDNPETVALCKSGRTGLFISSLEFHRANWDRQVKMMSDFLEAERSRIESFELSEKNRLVDARAHGLQMLIGAAIAFGLFMSVALVLIFARIESNLRGVQMIEVKEKI